MSEIAQSDALAVYLKAAENELEPCPWCETWLASECLAGNGCPTPDGRNGEIARQALAAPGDGG
ncbi:hypothetical protein ADT71_03000 [Novosphingobium sp. ST904]|nr:hypothetical protein ADT71_03000 [Novosphingobium sp. ST904]